jgi:tRNA threonylcarbamoyladenosine biosynthesis protein TsaB
VSLILCLETSTKNCSVAVVGEGKILSLVEDGSDGYTHAEKLNAFIERAMAEAKLGFADLQGVAVSEGPGSYTGLRIGVSAAKGLAYALGIRLIGINPLEAMARSVDRSKRDNLLIPMIDARRMEVFCAGFSGKDETVFKTRA